MFFDQWAFRNYKATMLVIQYFCPFLVALFTLYGSPFIMFELTQMECNERKSVKEASFLGKLNFMMTFNLIFCPFIANLVLDALISRELPESNTLFLYENFLSLESFYLRYFSQVVLICLLNQVLMDFSQLVKSFEKIIRNNGKTEFENWFYDLSFKSSIAVCFFYFGIFFSTMLPVLIPFIIFLLTAQFYIDKYNLMYIYPLEFESHTLSRRNMALSSFYAVILF